MTDFISHDLMTILSYTIAFTAAGMVVLWKVVLRVRNITEHMAAMTTLLLHVAHEQDESLLQETLSRLQRDGPWLHVDGADG